MNQIQIKAVVLDLGGVVVRIDWLRTLRALKLPKDHTPQDWANRVIHWSAYDQFERGKISPQDFHRELMKKLGISFSFTEFENAWNAIIIEPLPGIEDLLVEIKKKVPLYALSNTTTTHVEHLNEHYPVMKSFQKVFTSYGLAERKPEAAIFDKASAMLSIPPRNLLFIDDGIHNVEGARSAGWHSERSENSVALTREILERFGVL